MNLFEVFPKLAEHRVPIKALDIDSRVFFHWKKKGIIDYEPYKEEFENTSKTSDEKVKKWVQLNAFDMLWLLIVKELRKFNMDLETIRELKEYLNKPTYNIGEDSFNQFSEEDIQKNIKKLMPAALEDEVMKTILEGVTAKKLDDFLVLIDDEIQPYFTPIGTAFLSVLLNETNPILMIKNKINSDKMEFGIRIPEIALIDENKFITEMINDISQNVILNIPIRPFFEFIFTDDALFKYCKEFELFNSKEQKVLDILKSGDYKEINITKDSKGVLTIKRTYEEEVRDSKAKELRRLLGLNQYEKAEVIFRNDKHLVINNTVTQKIES
jgi:hypothetical protein